jgi:hypothetical protein
MPAFGDPRLEAVARKAHVSERTARRWRDSGDPRWKKFTEDDEGAFGKILKDLAPSMFDEAGTAPATKEPPPELDKEIARLSVLAESLHKKINLAKKEERSGLVQDYCRVIETLRKLRAERPGIEMGEGKMVPFDEADRVIAERDKILIPLLRGMPSRLAPVCVGRTAGEIQGLVESEVAQVMRAVEAGLG